MAGRHYRDTGEAQRARQSVADQAGAAKTLEHYRRTSVHAAREVVAARAIARVGKPNPRIMEGHHRALFALERVASAYPDDAGIQAARQIAAGTPYAKGKLTLSDYQDWLAARENPERAERMMKDREARVAGMRPRGAGK